MPDVPKHAWTHRPKALGGTDPIEIPGGAKWAYAQYSNETHSIVSSRIRLRLHRLFTNAPDLYTLEDQSEDTIRLGTNSWADYLGIGENGVYEVAMMASMTTRNVFDGFDTDLEPIWDNGAGDVDIIAASNIVFWTNRIAANAEWRATPEWDHSNLWLRMICQFNNVAEGVSLPFKIAMRIETAMTGSAAVGAHIWVNRISEGVGDITETFIG